MKTFTLISFTCHGEVHGPICQWYQDPCTTMAVHWIESGEEVPHAWETSAGPFAASSGSMVALRRAIDLPAEISGKASLVLEGDNVDFVEVYLDGEEVERSAAGGGRVELPISRDGAGARVLLAILLKAPATGSGKEVAGPRVSIRDRGQLKLLCDRRAVWVPAACFAHTHWCCQNAKLEVRSWSLSSTCTRP